ncbi:lysophospholipid acyltransferase family protein [Candidatus Chlorohelix sp.]|uniref:lysophospholipid acyltransferase family protein n=1 Tax=Candidatus Chlorohelix sp. TaxID=3139201 RepID=UPI003045B589
MPETKYERVDYMLAVYAFKLVSWISYLSPDWLRYGFAAIGGEIYYWAARGHSHYSDLSMQIVLGEPKINKRVRMISRRCFRNYVKYMTDFFRVNHLTGDDYHKVTGTGGWEYIEQAIAPGKGVMLVTPHFGNWDVSAMLVGKRGYKLTSVANDFNPPELNTLIQDSRRKQGLTIYSPKEALRGLYTALKRGEIVVLLLDSPLQSEDSESVIVNFFGKLARFPVGPARLALKTGASIMFGYAARQPGNNYYYGLWSPPLSYEVSGDKEKDVLGITQLFAAEIEKLVKRHPDQWYMFRKLWLSEEEVALYEQQKRDATERKTARARKSAGIAQE